MGIDVLAPEENPAFYSFVSQLSEQLSVPFVPTSCGCSHTALPRGGGYHQRCSAVGVFKGGNLVSWFPLLGMSVAMLETVV